MMTHTMGRAGLARQLEVSLSAVGIGGMSSRWTPVVTDCVAEIRSGPTRCEVCVSGSLTIVGLGPARPEHLTHEAVVALQAAANDPHAWRVYGLAHARTLAEAVVPGLRIRSLDYLYGMPGVDRPVAYADLAEILTRRAFSDGHHVLYLVAGSPLFYNDAVLAIRRRAAALGQPIRLVHGMAFLDLVLDRVYWTGHSGLALWSAWNVAFDGVDLDTRAPTLLVQLGEFGASGDALNEDRSPEMLGRLRDRLREKYPDDHPVLVLYSSGPPEYRSEGRRIALSELADRPVPVYSNLWIPSIDGPALEAELAPPSLRRSTSPGAEVMS